MYIHYTKNTYIILIYLNIPIFQIGKITIIILFFNIIYYMITVKCLKHSSTRRLHVVHNTKPSSLI